MIKILPIILECGWLPLRAVPAWPIVLVRGRLSLSETRRALIFARQQAELLVLPYLVLFLWYWIRTVARTGRIAQSWHSVPFVREAAHNRDDPAYLVLRRPHAWRLYVDLG